MLGYFILVFTVIPIIELTLLIKLGTLVGVGNTISLILLTGVLGALLLRVQGFNVIKRIDGELGRGIIPSEALMDGFLIFCGGLLLITPGILTDLLGFFLLIPAGRHIIKLIIKRKIQRAFSEGRSVRISSFNHNRF
ncbi:FxsA family protein [Candidatus Omnitrophota bacterium]